MLADHNSTDEIVKTLNKYQILNTLVESQFDDLAKMTAIITKMPIALISIIDNKRQWFISKVGVDIISLPLEITFCQYTILQKELFIVNNAAKDKRFADTPLVTDAPYIRFYAGLPLITNSGYCLGTLCVAGMEEGTLSDDVKFMLKTIAGQVIKNIEMNQTIFNLNKTMNEVHFMSIDIEDQKVQIEEKNRKIQESLNYAKRLQRTIFPTNKDLTRSFSQHFVFYRPKDIVGGDFYYQKVFNNKIFLALGDCTGHGVPGAMLTIMAKSILDSSIRGKRLESPDEILIDLQFNVVNVMNQQESETRDGLDIAICVIDKEAQTINFAGAKGSVLIADSNSDELIEIAGDRMCIGGINKDGEIFRSFTNKEVPYSTSYTYYFCSDGYVDQFGHTEQKFLKKRLKELILNIKDIPLDQQRDSIIETFDLWKGDVAQLDDVCVMAVKL